MIARDYHWRPSPRSRRRTRESKLGSWLMVALILSLAAHATLWILFDGIKFDSPEKLILTEPFRIEKVTMDAKTLEEIMDAGNEALTPTEQAENQATEQNQPEEPSATALAAELEQISAEDMAYVLNDEAKLTPGVESVENAALSQPATEAAVESLDFFPDDSELPLSEQGLATPGASLDPEHPTMSALDDLAETVAGMDALAEASGIESDPVPSGYASLDDVLKMQGGGDPGKPIWVPTDVLFEFNSADLKEEAKLSLMKLGMLIMQREDSIFILEGYTDLFGGQAYNLELSLNRAKAIRNWLVESLRLDESRLIVRGHGKENPLVPEGDIEQQAPNRRVEVTIKPKTKARPVGGNS